MLYVKNNEIREQRAIEIVKGGYRTFNPSHAQLIADGWEVYTPPIREAVKVSIEEQYKNRIVELIREKYSVDDELSIQRQRYTKTEEFEEYNSFVESCKQQAREELGYE
jgi:hypothetical protein